MKKKVCFGFIFLMITLLFASAAGAEEISSTGWKQNEKGDYYYIGSDGKAATGWIKDDGKYYYCDPKKKGIRVTGWVKYKKYYYYCDPKDNGARVTGWLTLKGKTYYLLPKKSGRRCTGWQKIGGKYYRFSKKGVRLSGWQTLNGKTYYLDPKKNDAMAKGWRTIGKKLYYFNSKGVRKTGWLKYKGGRYYLRPTKNGAAATGWYSVSGTRYYFDPKTGKRATGTVMIKGEKYEFDANGILVKVGDTIQGSFVDYSGKVAKRSSLRQMLKTALMPVGQTMYVWGGGWDFGQNGGNEYARSLGVPARWKQYFDKQTSSYDYTKTRYQIYDGLDCSGYIGWLMYNTFKKKSGQSGFVMPAENMASTFSSYGWGSYSKAGTFTDFRAGDIMSWSGGHVYIVVGQCKDTSVVLLHSSPKGVMLTGTYTRKGKKNSEAVKLAKKYMKKYYPAWYKKYPDCSRGTTYLTSYGRMRWYLTGNSVMTDSEGLRNMNASQVLKSIFS